MTAMSSISFSLPCRTSGSMVVLSKNKNSINEQKITATLNKTVVHLQGKKYYKPFHERAHLLNHLAHSPLSLPLPQNHLPTHFFLDPMHRVIQESICQITSRCNNLVLIWLLMWTLSFYF